MKTKDITDHAGIIAACVCVFHCVALPVLLVTSAMSENDTFHIWSLALTVLITGHALWHGYQQHCKHIVLTLGGLGLLTLLGGVGLHFLAHDHDHGVMFEYGERVVTILGSMLLIASHLYNLKFKQHCCSK